MPCVFGICCDSWFLFTPLLQLAKQSSSVMNNAVDAVLGSSAASASRAPVPPGPSLFPLLLPELALLRWWLGLARHVAGMLCAREAKVALPAASGAHAVRTFDTHLQDLDRGAPVALTGNISAPPRIPHRVIRAPGVAVCATA